MTIYIQECTMFNRLIYRELCTFKIKYTDYQSVSKY